MSNGPSQARGKLCPSCGARLHAVAGRCKICKADVAEVPIESPPRTAATRRQHQWHWWLGLASVATIVVSIILLTTGDNQDRPNYETRDQRPRRVPDPLPSIAPPPPPARPWDSNISPDQPRSEFVDPFVLGIGRPWCARLHSCNITELAGHGVCDEIASRLRASAVAQAIEGGKCRYDPRSGNICATSIGRLDCTNDAMTGPWTAIESAVAGCATATLCR